MNTLKIVNLSIEIEGKKIINNLNLKINSGEIHAIMGPNGTGKSTLTKVIMGDSNYQISEGKIYFNDKRIDQLEVDERSRLGIFLGMQMPMEIEGVSNADFLRSALRERNSDFKLYSFIKELDSQIKELKMNPDMIHRGINEGFSGGERKKNEILQMHILKPQMVMLDEIDSGLDVDSLKIVGTSIMKYFKKENPGILLVTHYQRLLNYIKPTHIHIMIDGTIIKSGDNSLVKIIEKEGYEEIKNMCASDVKENKDNE